MAVELGATCFLYAGHALAVTVRIYAYVLYMSITCRFDSSADLSLAFVYQLLHGSSGSLSGGILGLPFTVGSHGNGVQPCTPRQNLQNLCFSSQFLQSGVLC